MYQAEDHRDTKRILTLWHLHSASHQPGNKTRSLINCSLFLIIDWTCVVLEHVESLGGCAFTLGPSDLVSWLPPCFIDSNGINNASFHAGLAFLSRVCWCKCLDFKGRLSWNPFRYSLAICDLRQMTYLPWILAALCIKGANTACLMEHP